MGYDVRRKRAGAGKTKDPGIVYDQEGDVYDALTASGYIFASHNPDEPGVYWHWTSCTELYNVYDRYMRSVRWNLPRLNRTEFGVALRAVNESELTRKLLRTRDGNGKPTRITAYQGIKGPNSFFRRPKVGRPRKD